MKDTSPNNFMSLPQVLDFIQTLMDRSYTKWHHKSCFKSALHHSCLARSYAGRLCSLAQVTELLVGLCYSFCATAVQTSRPLAEINARPRGLQAVDQLTALLFAAVLVLLPLPCRYSCCSDLAAAPLPLQLRAIAAWLLLVPLLLHLLMITAAIVADDNYCWLQLLLLCATLCWPKGETGKPSSH